jgi:hypothetical protein
MSVSLYGSGNTVIQVVQASLSTAISTAGTTYVTSGLTATITPQSTTSKILVVVSGGGSYANTAGGYGEQVLYRNSSQISANGVDWAWYSASAGGANHSYMYLDSPATTSATSYTPYFRRSPSGGGGTYYFNLIQSTGPTVTITLIEIAYS